ncbi:MAG: hypothetical protein QXW70_01585 [Candidatus Anstonellales archaeon]
MNAADFQKHILIFLLAITLTIALAVIFAFFVTEQEVSINEFKQSIEKSQSFYVVMDLRNARTAEGRRAVMQCGVDIVASLNLLGKNQTYIVAYDNNKCIYENRTTSVAECESIYSRYFKLHISEGTGGSKFYTNRAEIQIPSFYEGSCTIVQRQG